VAGRHQKESASEALRLITEAKSKLDQDYQDLRVRYEDFRKRASLLFRNAQGVNLFEDRVAEVERRRSQLLIEKQEVTTRLAALEEAVQRGASKEALLLMVSMKMPSDTGGGPTAAMEMPIDPFMQQVTPLLLERETLLQQVGASHRSVKQLDAKIEALRNLLRTEAGQTAGPERDLLQIHMDSLRELIVQKSRELESLDTMFAQNQEEAKALSKEQDEERMLIEEGDQRKKLFEAVVQQLQAVDIGKDQGILMPTVTEYPASGTQIGPDMAKFLGMGGAMGLLTAIGLSFLLEMADKSFRSPDEITRQLGLPVIGHIPELDTGKDWKVVKDLVVDRSLATHHRPKSRISEAYRAVRAALYFGTRGQGHRVIQVTSADPGDGKSTLAANLAVAIASSGKRCLLMDADLRRPRVDKLFGVSNAIGVSSVVQDGMDVPDAIQATAIPNFEVMTVGPRVENPAELLLSPRFTELVSMLREQYDFVIIDTPPVLAVTDPAAVAAHVDGVVLVVRITKRSRPHARRATETLDLIGARVLGVVVNGVGEGTSGYGAGYGYNYGNPYRYGGSGGGEYSNPYFSEAAKR
jgi:capsular exopolysaccharide synthesis family protein